MARDIHLSLIFFWLLAAIPLLWAEEVMAEDGVAEGGVTVQGQDADHEAFFEKYVRPLLIEHCGECHIENQSGGLSLASRQTLLAGGDSGLAVTPGDPRRSPLLNAIRRTGDNPMPPEKPLDDQKIAIVETWIATGAVWPDSDPSDSATGRMATDEQYAEQVASHWAFQPLADVRPPEVSHPEWPRTSIDSFILHSLDQAGLTPAAEVSREEWLRRVTYALTGLAPTRDEFDAFISDRRAGSYERVIERLLASPRYGQHQARFWLDLARYSDTKGYVYAREERFWLHAWNYRDWVVDALNSDLSYDRFLLLQLAADQVPDRRDDDLAAMGFLTLGRRFLGVKHDIIDDRIDTVCRGTMAMTVGCARCHDHKFDPIPTSDYYSLYGIFDSCSEQITTLGRGDIEVPTEVEQKRQAVATTLAQRRREQAKRVRDQFADYLWAQTELHKYPAEGFDQIFSKSDLLPSFVRRFQAYLGESAKRHDRVFVAWRAFQSIDPESFGDEASQVTQHLQSGELGPVHPAVLNAFDSPPTSLREVADRYGQLVKDLESQWSGADDDSNAPDAVQSDAIPDAISGDDDAMEWWRLLYGPESPCQVPDRSVVHTETFFDSDTCNELWKLQGELERAIIGAGDNARFTIALVDNPDPQDARVFRRGNPLDRGPEVPRQFLSHLAGPESASFAQGSGRLELARHIIDPANPLTVRVIVNRIWAQLFGRGLVTTPSDFGMRSQEPSHPELLDFLARRFMQQGWSLKALHREILLSATYRQNSRGPSEIEMAARFAQIDPENRLLWRMNGHRLTFEELRDAILDACGTLNDETGGPATPILKTPYSTRRTLYALVDRQFLPSTFRTFDFASPDLHIPVRNETIVPQQALFLMNHPLVLDQVSGLAEQIQSSRQDDAARVQLLFEQILRRRPSDQERDEAIAFLSASGPVAEVTPPPTAKDWQYGYGSVEETEQRVVNFTPLPHFTGEAWQGSGAYPDATLGWVQLSATGGHPGNDRQHACVRRWVAPRRMHINIHSLLQHEAEPGDGIRAFVVSSQSGILGTEKVHKRDWQSQIDSIDVDAGETIDFVVDIDEQLNNDQFLWSISIQSNESEGSQHSDWDSRRDFTPNVPKQLSPLAQLAQILLCTNEFMFVD